MHRYHTLGTIPRKRHSILSKEDGGIYYEELKGNKGFSGPSSLLYHVHRPAKVLRTESLHELTLEEDPNPALRMRHFFSHDLPKGGSPVADRIAMLFNDDVIIYSAAPEKADDFFYRNSDGDEIVYINEGTGRLESPFGVIDYRPGDYLIIPRGILHHYVLDKTPQRWFITESKGEVATPKQYRNGYGQLIERTPYSERDFRVPHSLMTYDEEGEFSIIVKHRNHFTLVTMPHHPFDVVGWDGFYFPYAFNIHDFEPIVGRYHEPPPVHLTFEGRNFVICSFCPRPYDFGEDAIPAPYHHANVMSDEVILYASNDFMSRKGISYGSITLHPDGLVHGPHPGKTEESIGKSHTNELAVMVDTFYPLKVTTEALSCEDAHYGESWL